MENIEKRQRLNYILLAMICFAGILAGHFDKLFDPLYRNLKYGMYTDMFRGFARALILVVAILIIRFIGKKYFNVDITYNGNAKNKETPTKNFILISVIALGSILLISYQIGWNVKPFYDLGEKIYGLILYAKLTGYLCSVFKLFLVVMMLRSLFLAFENLLAEKWIVLLSGLIVTVTFGLYEIIIDANYLTLIYFVLNFVYALLYKLTGKNTIKTYLLIFAIYLF